MFCLAVVAALLASCDYPFEPIQKLQDAPFSMYGYLDQKADTQWIRVMPVRETSLLGPDPIDAVVTLEHVESGRTVTLSDSLFSYPVPALEGVAYAHNFWTAEPIEPGATYRLTATRSDGAATTATVVMPPDLEIDFLSGSGFGANNALLNVHAEKVLFVDMFYAMIVFMTGERAQSLTIRQDQVFPGSTPGTYQVVIDGSEIKPEGLLDTFRREIRLVVSTAEWPYQPDLTDFELSLPDGISTNVENGYGFVGGVADWTIPLHSCELLEPRPGGEPYCEHHFDRRSATLSGRVVRVPCGDPHTFWPVRLTERFADGGAVVRRWSTGWEGEFRFDGIEPGSELLIDIGPRSTPVRVPPLGPGERYVMDDLPAERWCGL